MILGLKTRKGGSAMKIDIKAALDFLDHACDTCKDLVNLGKEVVELIHKDDED